MKITPAFELEILQLAYHDRKALKTLRTVFDASAFARPEMGFLWGLIGDAYEGSGEIPSRGLIELETRSNFSTEEFAAYMRAFDKVISEPPGSPKTTLDSAVRYRNMIAFKTAQERASKLLEAGNDDAARDIWLKAKELEAKRVGALSGDDYTWVDWMGDFALRQAQRREARDNPDLAVKISTGIAGLDALMKGGYAPQDLFYILAVTNRGKSIMGVHLAYHAIMQGHAGFFLSTEMHVSRVAARFDSRYTGLLHEKFRLYNFTDAEEKEINASLERDREKYRSKLKIVSIPNQRATWPLVEEIVARARDELDGKLMFGVFDSADHISPAIQTRDYRLGQADNAWRLDSLAEAEDFAAIATAQSNREGADNTTNETMSESYVKSQCGDFIMALQIEKAKRLATPKHEIPDEEIDAGGTDDPSVILGPKLIAELTKSREGSKGRVPLHADLARMLFAERAMFEDSLDARESIWLRSRLERGTIGGDGDDR